jgi:hypothetical protein
MISLVHTTMIINSLFHNRLYGGLTVPWVIGILYACVCLKVFVFLVTLKQKTSCPPDMS